MSPSSIAPAARLRRLVHNQAFQPGERTVIWDGRTGTGFAGPGRYTYVCSAKDPHGVVSQLKGIITVVAQIPLRPIGTPTFTDVKPSTWYAGYLAVAEKQGLVKGYPDKSFKPDSAISRVEATAVIVRALGLEDMARARQNESVGFLDYQNIPAWATGYVNVASTVAKTKNGRLIVGYPSNFFLPLKELRRDEAALIVERLIDKETNRRIDGLWPEPRPAPWSPSTATPCNRTMRVASRSSSIKIRPNPSMSPS